MRLNILPPNTSKYESNSFGECIVLWYTYPSDWIGTAGGMTTVQLVIFKSSRFVVYVTLGCKMKSCNALTYIKKMKLLTLTSCPQLNPSWKVWIGIPKDSPRQQFVFFYQESEDSSSWCQNIEFLFPLHQPRPNTNRYLSR